jgi:DNA topoisomerase-1
MPKTLVIVESPAKAKTIQQFLGRGYEVTASYGHVRDLPESRKELPEELRKKPWADFGVNVDNGFEPYYVVPAASKARVTQLRDSAKGAERILLATDEDREGESISWHILAVLKPKKGVDVERIVFHEITPEAISHALRHPRPINESLVRAQETRRILDRLYGYSLSPVLWRKVKPKLSAGRVQSVAVRLTVLRERERMAFHKAEYWDLEAGLLAPDGAFKAQLSTLDGVRIASGQDFDPTTGQLRNAKVELVGAELAESLAEAGKAARPWVVRDLTVRPGCETPPAPFMTSTLQQEANRKLGFTSKRTMRAAQELYEGVDLDGERVGLITYMRTDSLALAERALQDARSVIRDLYGEQYLPEKPKRYVTKARNAQEAHEAIRPTDMRRRPEDVRRFLSEDQFKLYELIWKRTIASQMLPADVERSTVTVGVRVEGRDLTFSASGKRIVFPGFLRAYVEGSDDPDAEIGDRETILPKLEVGQELSLESLQAKAHSTKPPARYTEASLVKKLEEEGIGRPSTYASIIDTIQERKYIFKRGNELVPTFTAFAVTDLLEKHFGGLVDIAFTARMEEELDAIASGKADWVARLAEFYRGGDGYPGLVPLLEQAKEKIEYFALPIGQDPSTKEDIVVRIGQYGPYLQRGAGGKGNVVTLPETIAPADLTLEEALKLLAGPQAVGVDPRTGQCVFRKSGPYGEYLEVAASDDAPVRRITIPAELAKQPALEEKTVLELLSFPRRLGHHPETGEEIVVSTGRRGAYVKCGDEYRNLDTWTAGLDLTVEDAVRLLKEPKAVSRRGPQRSKTVIREFGAMPGAHGPVQVVNGRYGPYVTDGKVNATIPKDENPAELSADRALELLQAKAAAPPAKKFRRTVRARRSA